LAAVKKRRQRRQRSPSMIELIKNRDFTAGLSGWHTGGAMILPAEGDSAGNSVLLFRPHAFISRTVRVSPGDRLYYTIACRAQFPAANSPFILRLRWVKASGNFAGLALEHYFPPGSIGSEPVLLQGFLRTAPRQATWLDIRGDAPMADNGSGLIIDLISLKKMRH